MPVSALCGGALSGLPEHVLDRLFFIEGEELLEEMLTEVGVTSALGSGSGNAGREVGRGGNSIVAAASTAAAVAAAAGTMGTRATMPAGPCWHRVMLVPEDFTAALLQRLGSSPDGSGAGAVLAAPAAGDSSARLQPPDEGGLASAKPMWSPGSSTAMSPHAAPLNSARGSSSRCDTSSALSLRPKSLGADSDRALRRPSEDIWVEPEDASNKSLPRRRASVISIGRRESADVLRAAAGEGQDVRCRCGESSSSQHDLGRPGCEIRGWGDSIAYLSSPIELSAQRPCDRNQYLRRVFGSIPIFSSSHRLTSFPLPPYPNTTTATSVMARGFTAQTRSLLSSALQPPPTSADWIGTTGATRVSVQDGGYGPPENDFGGGFEDGPGSRRRQRRRSSSNRSARIFWGGAEPGLRSNTAYIDWCYQYY